MSKSEVGTKTGLFISIRKKKKELMNKFEDQKEDNNYFAQRRLRRGSDPRLQTCRGKLQNKRSKLNQEINRELMLRTGAENLYNAIQNKRLRGAVALELEFLNSNLHLLKEQLVEMNSSVELYQGKSSKALMSMIPLGLKETKEIDFREPFKDLIRDHYSEDPSHYDSAITEFLELREAMRTPERDESGVELLFEYFNQLYFIDRRFFPPDRSLGIYFEWYDSLTGAPSCQRTVAFEKACVLFNLGALYTQMGARHDRTCAAGLDSAVNCFLRAAGMLKYIHDTFTNAPSKDLCPEVLEMLIHLMLAQARECLHEKALLNHKEETEALIELAQEAAQVAQEYSQVHSAITSPAVKDYVPSSWVGLASIKAEHYRGRAYYHVAEALLCQHVDTEYENGKAGLSQRAIEMLTYLHKSPDNNNTTIDITVPNTKKERMLLGLSHGRESVLVHEEAMRQHRMCREFRKSGSFGDVLRLAHEAAIHLLEDFQDEDQFLHVLDPPPIAPSTKIQLTLTPPDFSQHRVEDIFKQLGPVAVFSAKHQWSAPRPVRLIRTSTQGFGFSVRGDAPVVIAGVDSGSLAERAGMREGDLVVSIANRDVKWLPHDEVVKLIRESGNSLHMALVTPCDKTYYKLPKCKSLKDLSPNSTTSSSSGVSSNSSSSSHYGSVNSSTLSSHNGSLTQKRSWNPFKKGWSGNKLRSAESLNDFSHIIR